MSLRLGREREATLLFAWNFAAVMAIALGRIVGRALFQAHVGPDYLPYMYVASPLCVAVAGLAHNRVALHVRRDALAWATPLVMAVLLGLAWSAVGVRWLYFALYAGIEVMVSLLMIQFWSSASERFTSREARDVFSKIATGGTIANIAVGVAIKLLVHRTGTAVWLLVCVACLLTVAGVAFTLERLVPHRATVKPSVRPSVRETPEANPPGTRHLPLLAPMIVWGILVTTFLEFQFNQIGRGYFGSSDEAWSEFHGWLQIATGFFALGMQRFVTARLLRHSGVAGALLLLPLTMGASAVGILVTPTLLPATVSELGDILRYTVNDAAYQLLYLPVPASVRARRKRVIDGVIKPGTEVMAGLALEGYKLATSAIRPLAAISAALVALWIIAIFRLRAAFAVSLAETLVRRRIVPGDPDEVLSRDIQTAVRDALRATDPASLRNALDLARLAPQTLGPELRALITHPEAAVRAQALACLALGGHHLEDDALTVGLSDVDESVRAAAATLAGDAQSELVAPLLDAPEASVAAAAAESLYRHGDAAMRARVVGRVDTLLSSTDATAREAGVEVARAIAAKELVPALVHALADRRNGRRAVDALVAVGPAAVPALLVAASAHETGPRALAALGQIDAPDAMPAVVLALKAGDERLRDAAAMAIARSWAGTGLSEAPLIAACEDDLARAFTAMMAAEGLGRAESTMMPDGARRGVPYAPDTAEGPSALISRSLRERTERARDRVFRVVSALQPEMDLPTILANLHEPDPLRRSNAVELLDALPWRGQVARLKPLMVALVDESARSVKLAAAQQTLCLPRRTRDGWVDALLDDSNPWMVACAAYYAGAAEVLSARPKLRALATQADLVVRETAAHALARIDPQESDTKMITTAQKVLFLKGIELFAAVPSEDLVEVARIATERDVEAAEVVFAEGDRGDALYFVVDGRVRLARGDRVLAEMGAQEVFGEMALLDVAPRSATATAVTPLTLLRIGQDDFGFILRERPEVAAGVLRVLTRRLRAALDPKPAQP